MGSKSTFALAVAWLLCACAEGVDKDGQVGFPNRLDDGGGLTSTSNGDEGKGTVVVEEGGDEGGPGGMPGGDILPDFGACAQDADCFAPGVSCFAAQGNCSGGQCVHAPSPPGQLCDDGDPCTEDDMCDGVGFCVGNDLDCTAPNAQGGACAAGACTGMSCVPGFGDCNGNMSDGCETALDTTGNCGGCGTTCSAGAHANSDCSSGTCQRSCQNPWENCDGNWANGCEVPTGVANQCSAGGLDPGNGCWTAYCGNSGASNATNFGSFYCVHCPNCNVPAAGACQWCASSTGTWYPQDSCACGSYKDLVCG